MIIFENSGESLGWCSFLSQPAGLFEREVMAKMGFEKQVIRRKYGNVPVDAEIAGRQFHFRCKLEYRWAQHLEVMKQAGLIKDWFYEFHTFYFGPLHLPPRYTPDFLVRNLDNSFEYFETKGMVEKRTLDALQAMFEERPAVRITVVFWQKPKISVQKRKKLERYCHAVIWDARSRISHEPIDMS